ncbi:MAG: hypothetical protein K0M58_02260 [Thiobacillus sp.]|nr:hypothetical protein [Thiobacillus sp.]
MNGVKTFIREGREGARSKPIPGHVFSYRLLRRHKQTQAFAFLRASSRIAAGFPE